VCVLTWVVGFWLGDRPAEFHSDLLTRYPIAVLVRAFSHFCTVP
jgi:hypothetical protein